MLLPTLLSASAVLMRQRSATLLSRMMRSATLLSTLVDTPSLGALMGLLVAKPLVKGLLSL